MAESPKYRKRENVPAPARERYEAPRMTIRTDTRGKADTEGGLTPAQRTAVLEEEQRWRVRNSEAASIINPQGDVVRRLSQNRSNTVSFAGVPRDELEDAVITHNHPGTTQRRAFGNTLATRIGSPLSPPDLAFAARNNVAEMRAVTYSGDGGGYIYSIRRPATGWRVTDPVRLRSIIQGAEASAATTANREYQRIARTSSTVNEYMQRSSRAELVSQWGAIQTMARILGARITRRRF